MIFTTFDALDKILYTKYIGEITIQEIKKFYLHERVKDCANGKIKILTDAINARFKLSINDISDIAIYNNHYLEKYDVVYEAFVTDNPKETALSMIYQKLSQADNYRFQVFNRKNSALAYLQKMDCKKFDPEKSEFSNVLINNAKNNMRNQKDKFLVEAL